MQHHQHSIAPSDTIFNDPVKDYNTKQFQTPPQKKITQSIPSNIGGNGLNTTIKMTQRGTDIFRTPTNQKFPDSNSGSKTSVKEETEDNLSKQKKLASSFQQQTNSPKFSYQPQVPQVQFENQQHGNDSQQRQSSIPQFSNLKFDLQQKQNERMVTLFNNKKNPKIQSEEREKKYGQEFGLSKGKQCNCKKTKCLKLYCDCFAAGELCGPDCSCTGCHNNQSHIVERNKMIETILERNSDAFNGKIMNIKQKHTHSKGCNCRKSGCQKKYCECFSAGVRCNELCKCEECKNIDQEAINLHKAKQLENILDHKELKELLKGSGYIIIPTADLIKKLQQVPQVSDEPPIIKQIKLDENLG